MRKDDINEKTLEYNDILMFAPATPPSRRSTSINLQINVPTPKYTISVNWVQLNFLKTYHPHMDNLQRQY